jgi:BirA family biotin operon repressor/biotin-[acetyl-CoA-carboxylase] ligase
VAPISLLEATGLRLSPDALLDALAPAFAEREAHFLAHGFGPTRRAWLQHAARLGETVTARLAGRTLTGRFEDVDETGRLILAAQGAREAIPAAEIFFEDAPCS